MRHEGAVITEQGSPMHSTVLTRELLQAIRAQYRCDWWGYHGVRHWARVRANTRLFRVTEPVRVGGRSVSFYSGPRQDIDPVVCDLFAVFHDACRVNEYEDPGHGAMHWPSECMVGTSNSVMNRWTCWSMPARTTPMDGGKVRLRYRLAGMRIGVTCHVWASTST